MSFWLVVLMVSAVIVDIGLIWTAVRARNARSADRIEYWNSVLQYFGWISTAFFSISTLHSVGAASLRYILEINFLCSWVLAFLLWRVGNRRRRE